MTTKFNMNNEYWSLEIKEGSSTKVVIQITFKEKEIPESDLKELFRSLRLLLEATGRLEFNPSRR